MKVFGHYCITACSIKERNSLGSSVRYGGLRTKSQVSSSSNAFTFSKQLTLHLVELIISQSMNEIVDKEKLVMTKRNIKRSNRARQSNAAESCYNTLSQAKKRCLDLASERGSSSWLSVLPIEEHGYYLNKGEFRDALRLCYGWQFENTPSSMRLWSTIFRRSQYDLLERWISNYTT